jgi:nucleotidyltransferase substrate binding protein (TIGR01987 family)
LLAQRALASLQELVVIQQPSKIERDAAIERFEYTCEAVWKAAQRYLLVIEGVSVGSPKGCIRACRETGLLSEEQAVNGLEMVDDRNLTIHTYNEAIADEISRNFSKYSALFTAWLGAMEARMTQE